MKIIFN